MKTIIALLALLTIFVPDLAQAQQEDTPLITSAEWSAYKQQYLDASGRIIDDANGRISHSEGQGYGLLLAYLAGNRTDFELIFSFTQTEMLLRDDRLSAWRWDPSATPHVTDINNATDGDILIAYALARAGDDWNVPEFSALATQIVKAIGARTVQKAGGRPVIMPAAHGFDRSDRNDGPVVNLSYWIFEAFPLFAKIDPEVSWGDVREGGLSLIVEASVGPEHLPPNWVSLNSKPKPAQGFDPEFGYDALRIPLYLVRAGITDERLLAPYAAMADGIPLTNLMTGNVRQKLTDPGYAIIPALARCALNKTPVPSELKQFTPSLYFPSTLHLLALVWLRENGEACG